MDSECFLTLKQVHATFHYPDLDQFIPHPIPFSEDPLIYV